jgi:hypothetical protein
MVQHSSSFSSIHFALFLGGLLAGSAVHAQAALVHSPTSGVLCDRISQSCYDRQGVSVGLTRQHFGSVAANRVMAALAGRPQPRDFRLSNGALCDLQAERCWSDGFVRRTVSVEMSRDLFGSTAANGNDGRQVTRYSGFCTLAQGGRPLYDGPYALRRVSYDSSGITRYVVLQNDARRFNFSNRGGRIEVSDGTGDWPVALFDHGYTGVFRWRDMTLVATREHSGLRQGRESRVVMDQLFLDP